MTVSGIELATFQIVAQWQPTAQPRTRSQTKSYLNSLSISPKIYMV